MGRVVVHNQRRPDASPSVGSGSGGGGVEEIWKRLGSVETHVSDLRSQVSVISATIPHLATKADIGAVRKEVADVRTDLSAQIGEVKAEMATTEAAIIRWIVATLFAAVGLGFTFAKFVH
jgi:hypothetical protein